MCGRFAFYSPTEAVVRLFGVENGEDLPPRYNIAPTQDAPVVHLDEDGVRRLTELLFTAETHNCRDAGGRVTQGAVTERTRRKTKTYQPQRRKGRKVNKCRKTSCINSSPELNVSGKSGVFLHKFFFASSASLR